jgi:hypothetical protein
MNTARSVKGDFSEHGEYLFLLYCGLNSVPLSRKAAVLPFEPLFQSPMFFLSSFFLSGPVARTQGLSLLGSRSTA